MAWLSLFVVSLYFFTPGFGSAPRIVAQDIAIEVTLPLVSAAFNIPFTGPLRLFLYATGVWLVLWLVPYLLDKWIGENALREGRPYKDFLARFKLWDDLVSAFQPVISDQIAVRLAKYFLWFMLFRAIAIYFFQVLVDVVMPWLTSYLTSQIGVQFVPLISEAISQGLMGLIGLKAENGATLVVFCILVLISNYAFIWEKHYRYYAEIQRRQIRQKKEKIFPITE